MKDPHGFEPLPKDLERCRAVLHRLIDVIPDAEVVWALATLAQGAVTAQGLAGARPGCGAPMPRSCHDGEARRGAVMLVTAPRGPQVLHATPMPCFPLRDLETHQHTEEPQMTLHRPPYAAWLLPLAELVLLPGHLLSAETFTCTTRDVGCLIASIAKSNANGPGHDYLFIQAGTYQLTRPDNAFRMAPTGSRSSRARSPLWAPARASHLHSTCPPMLHPFACLTLPHRWRHHCLRHAPARGSGYSVPPWRVYPEPGASCSTVPSVSAMLGGGCDGCHGQLTLIRTIVAG